MIHNVQCPYCGEWADVHEEEVQPGDSWIEDCEVCCHPMYLVKRNGSERGVQVGRAS